MPRHTQFGMRRSTASPRRLVLRLVMLDLSNGFFEKLSESFDVESSQQPGVQTATTFELPLTEERQETTSGATLDAAAIGSLRRMFILLDEWDRALQNRKTGNCSEECEIPIDTQIH